MSSTQTFKSPIARRFILFIVLFSSVITVFITAIQLYRDYNSDITLINSELEQIDDVHLSSLTSALWASNTMLLQTSIEGILKIRDVQYVDISDDEKNWVQVGEIKGNNNIQRSYPMNYRHRNRDLNIGKLTVNVSLDGVYHRLIDKIWVILISNGIKTALVAMFIYFLFYRLVARHLTTISEFSQNHDALSDKSILSLNRKKQNTDEFDILVHSINDMHRRLHEQITELDKQKQNLSLTLNSIGDAVVTTDAQGNVTRLNPVAEQLTGWSNEEAHNRPLKTIFPIVNASTREPIENPVDKVLSTGETVYLSNHTTLISRDGTEYQIADSAAPIIDDSELGNKKILGMVLVFNDVTQQYQLRQSLQESQKRLQLIHTQLPGIVYQFKVDEHGEKHIPYASSAVEKYLGFTPAAVMNDAEEWFSLVHPNDYLGLQESILVSLTNLSIWSWTGRFIRKDGKTIWLQGTSTPEKLDDGSTLWNGLFVDVTEQKMQEEQLRRTQKMDALGKLTGGIAHDYNNILGIVLGYAVQIAENPNDPDTVIKYAHIIEKASNRGAELAKKLLSFSQNKQPNVSLVNINQVLLDSQHMLEKTLTARHELILNLDDNLWQVELDSGDLEDAVVNMSINAQHAMKSAGGQLTISTSNESLSETDTMQLGLNKGDYVLLSITDTGSGMDKETKERIFDPFFSTKGEKGTGLGLSQVYGFVERSGGAVNVYSEIDHGSRFTLYFPRSHKSILNFPVSADESTTNITGNESILVVDDEPAMADLAREIFTAKGYKVFTAGDGKEALKILKNMPAKPIDLIVSDVIMPNMDGYQLAAHVRKQYPKIKIQMVSGFADNRHTTRVNDDLHQNMLHKPYTSISLLKRVRTLLDETEKTNNLTQYTVLTVDDDEDIQTLYKINLAKLGYNVVASFNGRDAVSMYEKAQHADQPIDIMIVDLSMPGGMGGIEVAKKVRKINPSAKIIVASGHSEGAEMTNPEKYGFDASLEKNFNIKKIKKTLDQLLTPDAQD